MDPSCYSSPELIRTNGFRFKVTQHARIRIYVRHYSAPAVCQCSRKSGPTHNHTHNWLSFVGAHQSKTQPSARMLPHACAHVARTQRKPVIPLFAFRSPGLWVHNRQTHIRPVTPSHMCTDRPRAQPKQIVEDTMCFFWPYTWTIKKLLQTIQEYL